MGKKKKKTVSPEPAENAQVLKYLAGIVQRIRSNRLYGGDCNSHFFDLGNN